MLLDIPPTVATLLCLLIEAGCRIYASVQHPNIGPDNGLAPVQHQAIV